MRRQHLFIWLPIIVALSSLAALILVSPVYAQDEQPPQPEEAPVEVVVDSEELEPDLAPILEAAEEAGVTLVDGSGEPLALASEEAAAALEGGDPWYKVGTVTYNFATIQAAIDSIAANGLPSDGLIHIEAGTYTEQPTVNADTVPILNGLKGLVSTAVDGVPQTSLTDYIYINSVDLGFTIKGFKITATADEPYAGIRVSNSTGTLRIEDVEVKNSGTGMGILIEGHTGAVILNRVKSSNNAHGGGFIGTTGGVTITNSTFDWNGANPSYYSSGIVIDTGGSVLLDGVSASNNSGNYSGLTLKTPGAITIKNSVVNNNTNEWGIVSSDTVLSSAITLVNVYANNNWRGLGLFTRGNITLTGVHGDENDAYGAELDTCSESGGACQWLGTGAITIKDSTFDNNQSGAQGLTITANGTITITNVSVSGTLTMPGARLNNSFASKVVPVTVTSSTFNGNDGAGLVVLTKGAITLNKVVANLNVSGSGAILENIYDTAASNVTINGSAAGDNQFNNNGSKGLRIHSNGTISIKKAQAEGNTGYGIELDNTFGSATPGVTLTSADILGNDDIGLLINSEGNVSITGVHADGNTASAAYIETCNEGAEWCQWLGPGKVTIKDSTFDDTDETWDAALYVTSRGAISLTNVSASGNAGFGIRGASLRTLYSQLVSPVTVAGGTFNNNEGEGLVVFTNGAITLNKVKASSNSGWGARLGNHWATSSQPVTVTGSTNGDNQFLNNDYTGLRITSNGAVSIKYVEASSNGYETVIGGEGVVIDNTTSTTSSGVTLTSVWADGNLTASGSASIMISTNGLVVISGGHSNDNLSEGLVIENDTALDTAPKPVTISNFSANGNDYGIHILSKGVITLTNITVNNTTSMGISLDNHWLVADITLTKVNVSHSAGAGIEIASNGKLTYKGGEVSLNLGGGIALNPTALYSTTSVTLSDLYIQNNTGAGMLIFTKGAITLTNVRSNDNTTQGMVLDNTACGTASPCNVSLLTSGSGVNEFHSNGNWGLVINTYGIVALSKVNIASSGGGVSITNNAATIPANVTITGGKFQDNGSNGIKVLSKGIITLNGIEASNSLNGWEGAFLDNRSDTTGTKGINVIKSVFNGNASVGLNVYSYGALVLNTIQANDNAALGAYINNAQSTLKPVTILGTFGTNNFNNNHDTNLMILSLGPVALTNVISNGSEGEDGIFINNDNGTGIVTLTNVTANYNHSNGIYITTAANVTIKGITSMFNYGTGYSYSGLYISTNGVGTAKVAISNGIVACNGDYGIRLDIAASKPYTLTNVFYFGNNSDNLDGEVNLLVN
jgi:putative surface-exposed virulence protein